VAQQNRSDLAKRFAELGKLLVAEEQQPKAKGWLLQQASSL
jgi:hypothetical protein